MVIFCEKVSFLLFFPAGIGSCGKIGTEKNMIKSGLDVEAGDWTSGGLCDRFWHVLAR